MNKSKSPNTFNHSLNCYYSNLEFMIKAVSEIFLSIDILPETSELLKMVWCNIKNEKCTSSCDNCENFAKLSKCSEIMKTIKGWDKRMYVIIILLWTLMVNVNILLFRELCNYTHWDYRFYFLLLGLCIKCRSIAFKFLRYWKWWSQPQ